MQSVIGIFGSRVAAEQAVRGLMARGLSSAINYLLKRRSGQRSRSKTCPQPTPKTMAWAKPWARSWEER